MRLFPLALLLTSCASIEEHVDVPYDDRYGDATKMNVYLPEGGGEQPAVLLIHGGGWYFGSRDHYIPAAERLARSGYVAATIDYRLVPEGKYPAAVQDCVCALSFLRSKADDWGIDPNRVAVAGYSAGAHLASLIGVAAEHPHHVPDCDAGPTGPPQAVVSGDGPLDLRGDDHEIIRDFLGGGPGEIPETYTQASPIAHVAPGAPAFLFVHATGDVVPIEEAEAMRDALEEEGNDARLLSTTGGGHLFNPGTNAGHTYFELADDSPEAWLGIVDFLDDTIGPP